MKNKMINEIKELLKQQELNIAEMNLTSEEIDDYVFGEGDVVQHYLGDNEISEDSVDLEDLRDLQHGMAFKLKEYVA